MMSRLRRIHAELEHRHVQSERHLHEIATLHGEVEVKHRAAQELVAKLEVARARAEAANRAKGTFLANVSHELRTPMNAVLGMTELLLDEPLPEAQRSMAQTIRTAGTSLLAIINDVLDLSKIEANELRLHTADIHIARVVEDVLGPMRVLADAKGLALHVELDDLPKRPLLGDELRLRQILNNLIGNAIKFTHVGNVVLRVVAAERSADSLQLRFSVSDTGIGMSQDELHRVFNAFEQADESTTRKFGGTGLGLSISKRLVALMGGELTACTTPGRDSVFAFEVAFGFSADQHQAASELQSETPRVYGHSPQTCW
jgi:two-component system sensor histidine kinase/response regulator